MPSPASGDRLVGGWSAATAGAAHCGVALTPQRNADPRFIAGISRLTRGVCRPLWVSAESRPRFPLEIRPASTNWTEGGQDSAPSSMAPKRKAPGGVAAGSPAAKEPQVFSGCRLVFWAHRHMAVTQQRAKQLGGVQQPAVAADTTHVICPPNLTAQQAADKLRGWSGWVAVRVLESVIGGQFF